MPYRERLNLWVLVRLLPNLQRAIVGQYRNRSDADGHLEMIRRLMPNAEFVVMFNRYIRPIQIYSQLGFSTPDNWH